MNWPPELLDELMEYVDKSGDTKKNACEAFRVMKGWHHMKMQGVKGRYIREQAKRSSQKTQMK